MSDQFPFIPSAAALGRGNTSELQQGTSIQRGDLFTWRENEPNECLCKYRTKSWCDHQPRPQLWDLYVIGSCLKLHPHVLLHTGSWRRKECMQCKYQLLTSCDYNRGCASLYPHFTQCHSANLAHALVFGSSELRYTFLCGLLCFWLNHDLDRA